MYEEGDEEEEEDVDMGGMFGGDDEYGCDGGGGGGTSGGHYVKKVKTPSEKKEMHPFLKQTLDTAGVILRNQRQRKNISAMKQIFEGQHVEGYWTPSSEGLLCSFIDSSQYVDDTVMAEVAKIIKKDKKG